MMDFNPQNIAQPKSRGVAAFHLPELRLTPHFSDPQDHLSALRKQLENSGSVIVQGMGGIGKTQLALKYSHTFRTQYAGIWWFSADAASSLIQECQIFCAANNIFVPEGMPPQSAMKDWLAKQPRWLLVYDDVEDLKHIQAFLPIAAQHHVLITSRLPKRDGMHTLMLGIWNGDDALTFLRQRLPKAADDELRRLSAALDGLPLALEQACAYLISNRIPLDNYIAKVNALDSRTALLQRQDSHHAGSVLATLSLSFDKLSEPAQALLQLCGWLSSEPIPEYLFIDNADKLPESLQIPAGDALVWRGTVAELEHYALCQVREQTMTDHAGNNSETAQCLVLHPLTQAAIRASVVAGGADVCMSVVGLLSSSFPSRAAMPEFWARCQTLMPHVLGLATYYSESWAEQRRYASLLTQLALYMENGPALLQDAQRLRLQALEILQRTLEKGHPATLLAMDNYARVLLRQDNFVAAREIQEKILAISTQVHGEQNQQTPTALNNLAMTLYKIGDLANGQAMQEKALEISRAVFGDEHPTTLAMMGNQANVLHQQGELAAAQILQQSVLEKQLRILGEENPATLQTMNNLAVMLTVVGDLLGARALLEKVAEVSRRVLGESHTNTRLYIDNLAKALNGLGDHTAAQALLSDSGIVAPKQPAIPARDFIFWHDADENADATHILAAHRTWLKHLTLDNYRCFQHLKVDFNTKLTVFVARNGAGKTTLLDSIAVAVGLFVDSFYIGKAVPITERDVRLMLTDEKLGVMEPQYPARVQATAEIDSNIIEWEANLLTPKAGQPIDSRLQIKEIGEAMQKAVTDNKPVILPLIAYFGANRFRPRTATVDLENAPNDEKASLSRTAGYQDCLDFSANYEHFEKWFIHAAKTDWELRSRQTAKDGGKDDESDTPFTPLLKAVCKAVDECLDISGWRNLHFSFQHSFIRDTLVMEHKEHGVLPTNQLSDGVRIMVALVADIAHRAVRLNAHFGSDAAKKTPGLVLLDEIDLHLHPAWQQVVLQNLNDAFPCMQFMVTTHSPQVISTVSDECIRILENGEVHSAPKGTKGAESARILEQVFGVKSRPPDDPNTKLLHEYLTLVFADKWADESAIDMRKRLDDIFSNEEPELTRADLHIENRQWELSNEEN